jgi:hypothetical protein
MSTFPTKTAAEAWLAHHGYKPRSWGSARARVWEPPQQDHIAIISQDLKGAWTIEEHDKS